MTLDLDAIKGRLAGMTEADSLVVTTCGTVEIDGEERDAIVLEGSRDAIREGTKWFGDDVVIAPPAARTDIPALVAEVERLREYFAAVEAFDGSGIRFDMIERVNRARAALKGTTDD